METTTAPARRVKPIGKPTTSLPPAGVHTNHKLGREADLVLAYWRAQEAPVLPKAAVPEGATLSSLTLGLGDTLMLSDLPRAAKEQGGMARVMSVSRHFRELMRFNPNWVEPAVSEQSVLVNAASLVRHRDCGNGHYLQRIRRAFGFEVSDVPRGCLVWRGQRKHNRVILHFDPGPHVNWQRQNLHPNARRLMPQTRAELEKFIASEPGLEFISVGNAPDRVPIKGTRHVETKSISALVELIGGSGWHIGILSGPLHVAVALELRVITILDYPEGWRVFLPALKANQQTESEWLAPQSVVLHQTESGPLCPRANLEGFKRAFAGQVYPYWKTDWCSLIHERL
jgi:hypothetical protein